MTKRTHLSIFFCTFTTAYSMFTQGADGAIMSAAGHFGRRLVPMVTYDDLFTFVIMLCAIVTLVLNFKRKK